MNTAQVIPVLRVFDYHKTLQFYVDWLGFEILWLHRFDEEAPLYMEIQYGTLHLHLSEHHGDCTPGSKVFVWCDGLVAYHQQLLAKGYAYNKPRLEKTFYDAVACTVTDPFGNQIVFNELYDADKHQNVIFDSNHGQ